MAQDLEKVPSMNHLELANQAALDDKPWASGVTGFDRSPEEAARIRLAGRAGQTASGSPAVQLPPVTAGQIGNRPFTEAVKGWKAIRR
jgi:hypothetical protein